MDDACWKCQSVLHHSRDCSKTTDVRIKRNIQEFRNKVTHSSQFATRQMSNRSNYSQKLAVYGQVPPFILVKNEVERLTNVYQDIVQAEYELPVNCSIDVDEMKQRLADLRHSKLQFSNENASVRELRVTRKVVMKNWSYIDEEVKLLFLRMEDVGDLQIRLNDQLYKKESRYVSAISFLEFWYQSKRDVSGFVTLGLDIYSGRPLRIPEIKKDWHVYKNIRKQVDDRMTKFKYLFSDATWKILSDEVDLLHNNWKLLKECKDANERKPARDLCKVCFDALIKFSLMCGHVYCGACISSLKECAFCRRSSATVIELYLDEED